VAKKKVVLSFPPTLIEEPVTYHLVKDFDLSVNILRATVRPRDRGRMVLELEGTGQNIEQAFDWLEDRGVQLDPLVQEMRHHPERCTHCTACTALCPTGALSADPDTRELVFDHAKCIICEACLPACSYGALASKF